MPPPIATTFGSSRMPLCGRPASEEAASSVVSVRNESAVAGLVDRGPHRVRTGEAVAKQHQRVTAAIDDRHGGGVALLVASGERGLRGLQRGGGRQRPVGSNELLRVDAARERASASACGGENERLEQVDHASPGLPCTPCISGRLSLRGLMIVRSRMYRATDVPHRLAARRPRLLGHRRPARDLVLASLRRAACRRRAPCA